MKAIVYIKYGPPEVLQIKDVDKPVPKSNEVLIKVHAATVNRTDCGFRRPDPFIVRFFSGLFRPKLKILGNELAGEVEKVGKDVKLFKSGDKVFGLTGARFGAHAEYVCLPETAPIVIKPENLNYEEAAAVCDGAMLAYTCIRKMNLQKGQKILIYGASGSIGTGAVQIAKYLGVEVTAVCNTKNIDIIKSLGADEVIDYTNTDITKIGKIFDIYFDAVGKSSFFRCKNLIKKDGLFVTTDFGFLAQNLFLILWTLKFSRKKVLLPIPKENKDDIVFFKLLVETGKYKPVIDRRYPIEQIVDAYKYVETEQKTGNVVITIA